MSDSLADILGTRQLQEPPEVAIIKEWVMGRYQIGVGVLVQPKQIIIAVPSAALAGTLRLELHQLQQACSTDKRLVIRIGS